MLLLLLGLLASPSAHAGACCAGTTSTVPTRLGECETWMVGLGVAGESSFGQWSSTGASTPSSLQDDALIGTLAGAWAWDRRGQVGVTLPTRLNHKSTADTDAWGGGPGDLRAFVTWDPFEEWARGGQKAATPVPVLTGGVRLPTGRHWGESDAALFEDVTGLPGVAAMLGASVERTLDRTPWALGVDAEVGTSAEADSSHLRPTVTAWGSIGRYLGSAWSISGSLTHVETFSLADDGNRAARTSLGVKATTSRRLKWRAWGGVESDLPVPGLGQANLQLFRVGAGMAMVR